MQAHCIIKSGLDVSGSMRCRTVKVADTNGKGLCAALKIRSYRCSQNSELVFVSRLYSDNRIASEHIRTYVKSCTASERRYISLICFYHFLNSLHKSILGENRHFKTGCTLLKSLSI